MPIFQRHPKEHDKLIKKFYKNSSEGSVHEKSLSPQTTNAFDSDYESLVNHNVFSVKV